MRIHSLFPSLCSGIFASLCCFPQAQAEKPLQQVQDKVVQALSTENAIPGLDAAMLDQLREGILARWDELTEKGELCVEAADREARPCFVAIQGVVEHVLAAELNHTIKDLEGVIHTPMPATPLCMRDEISEDLVDPSIAGDAFRLSTVKARASIVRDFLNKGGYLHIAYPKEGFSKRTFEQQEVYLDELRKHPYHLFDTPLDCAQIDPELIGATYLFSDLQGNRYAFAIQMAQAKNAQENGRFGLWFGAEDHPAVQQRVQKVSRFLMEHAAGLSPRR